MYCRGNSWRGVKKGGASKERQVQRERVCEWGQGCPQGSTGTWLVGVWCGPSWALLQWAVSPDPKLIMREEIGHYWGAGRENPVATLRGRKGEASVQVQCRLGEPFCYSDNDSREQGRGCGMDRQQQFLGKWNFSHWQAAFAAVKVTPGTSQNATGMSLRESATRRHLRTGLFPGQRGFADLAEWSGCQRNPQESWTHLPNRPMNGLSQAYFCRAAKISFVGRVLPAMQKPLLPQVPPCSQAHLP